MGTAVGSAAENLPVLVFVNNAWRGSVMLDVDEQHPCIAAPLLQEWGISDQNLVAFTFSAKGCVLPRSLADSQIKQEYDPAAQMLDLSVPTELLSHVTNGVATSRWDDGINTAFLDYDVSYSHYTGGAYTRTQRQHSLELDLTWGVNLGPWRFRYKPVYSSDAWSDPRWHTERAAAFRTVRSLRSLLTLGDSDTSSDIFDSVSYRGISLVSDDRMLPDELCPLAPWIHGFARTEAQVRVRQYGTVIYQTTVPAGAFILKDVYPRDASADIEMTIKESDGTETERTIPYTAMPNLVRQRQWKFNLTAGKYRPYYTLTEQEPGFTQATLSHGLPNDFTLYGGTMLSSLYQATAAGVGKRFQRWGALSLDVSGSRAVDPRLSGHEVGSMGRLRYTKAFSDWESSFSLTAQYYPGQRYRTFNEAISQQTRYWWEWENGKFVGEMGAEKKNQFTFSYNQNFSEEDSLWLTLSSATMRGRKDRETTLELGYTGTWNNVDYSIDISHNHARGEKDENLFTLSFAIPLTRLGLRHNKLNLENTLAKNGTSGRKVGITGTALKNYNLSYNVSNTVEDGSGSAQRMSVDYQYNAGEIMGIYSQNQLSSTKYLGLTGSVVAHQGGITLGQSMGETVAIVEVQNTGGIGVTNQYGTTTDSRGFAVIGNMTPYRVNELMLNTFDLPPDRRLPVSENEVVPTAGAIMYSRFKAPEPIE